jgi:hypothetical protein
VEISVGVYMGVGVYVALGRLTYAQRFSCVGVGGAKSAALTGEEEKKKKASPRLPIIRSRMKVGKPALSLVEVR